MNAGEIGFKNPKYNFKIVQTLFKEEKFILIHTQGLSEYNQPIKNGFEDYKQIELYFLLPNYFDLKNNTWPIQWLNKLAEIPQKNNTWFGPGDTIPAGKPAVEIDQKLKCSYFILSDKIRLTEQQINQLTSYKTAEYLAVIPIFKKEFEFKTQAGAYAFFELMKLKGIDETIDVFREPIARKKFMGIF